MGPVDVFVTFVQPSGVVERWQVVFGQDYDKIPPHVVASWCESRSTLSVEIVALRTVGEAQPVEWIALEREVLTDA